MSLIERVEMLCNQRNITIYKLEKELQLARNTIKNWETSAPSSRVLLLVADYFEVSTDFLLGRTINEHSHKDPVPLVGYIILKKVEDLEISECEANALANIIDSIVISYRNLNRSIL